MRSVNSFPLLLLRNNMVANLSEHNENFNLKQLVMILCRERFVQIEIDFNAH